MKHHHRPRDSPRGSHRFALRLWPHMPFSWIGPILLVTCLVLKQMLLRILLGAV